MAKKAPWFDTRVSEFTTRQPTAAQLKSLRQFVADQGAGWHEALLDCWVRGVWPKYGYDYGTVTAHCQQIRNQFGDRWLATWTPDKLPEGRRYGQRRESERY